MKILIASDIHGNVSYLKKVDELINREKIEDIFLLGDLFNYRNDDEIISILNKHANKIYAVKGNCDNEDYQDLLKFNYLNEYFTLGIDGYRYLVTHGHLLYKYVNLEYDFVINGHSHIYNLFGEFINPGSVGSPRVNKEHTCIIYEDKVFKLYDLDTLEIIGKRSISNN